MSLWRFGATLAVLVGAVSACSSKKEDLGPGIPIESAPLEIANAVCPKAYNCCMPGQLMGNDLAGSDEADCKAKTTDNFKKSLAGVLASQKKGRLAYRADRLAECLQVIRSSTCQSLNTTNHFTGVRGCDMFIVPLLEAGAACGGDGDCIEGFCEKPDMAAGDGVCRLLAKKDESCVTVKCMKNLICDGTSKTCIALIEEGGTCSQPLACASANCAAPDGGTGNGTCAAAKADKCFYSSACSYGGGCRPASGLIVAGCLGLILGLMRRRSSRNCAPT